MKKLVQRYAIQYALSRLQKLFFRFDVDLIEQIIKSLHRTETSGKKRPAIVKNYLKISNQIDKFLWFLAVDMGNHLTWNRGDKQTPISFWITWILY